VPEPLRRRLAVLAGGAVGTALRAAVAVAVPVGTSGFPWPTLAVNVTGAAALGIVVVRLGRRASGTVVVAAVGIGVLGSYTTFATFAVEVIQLWPHLPATAVSYGLVSVVLGVAAAWAGVRLAERRPGATA
jgi:CrcB protein